jgi:ParB family chromosome partitioning protein
MTINTDLYADTTAPVLEHLDPKTLTIGLNIRSADHVDLDPEFVADIKTRGVLEPIVAWRDPTSAIVVKAGQRRTLAAILAERTSVPVYIHATEPDTVERIGDQWAENHQRRAMTLADEAAAVEELALFGVSGEMIAAQLHIDLETIDAARKIVKSPTAKTYAEQGLSLDFAELVAEMEAEGADGEALIEVFNDAAAGQDVEHVRAGWESEKARVKAIADATAELATEGIRVVERPGDDGPEAPKSERLLNLKISGNDHATCPGKAVYLNVHQDWRTSGWMVTTTEICTDWKANGHEQMRYAQGPAAKVPAAELPDEEREAKKAERKHVIDSNRAWAEATSVRREWLLGFGSIKKPLDGAARLVAQASFVYMTVDTHNLALVGLDRVKVEKELVRAGGPRALHIATAIAVSSFENTLNGDAWRTQLHLAGPYLEALGKWGYGLAEIEKRIITDWKATLKVRVDKALQAVADEIAGVEK